MKKIDQKELIDDIFKNKFVKYALYGIVLVAGLYVSGIVMRVIGNTAESYKFMNNSIKG
ncbi:hypothetical protein OAV36_04730 [Flavobacteriales bacterium]|nr:hypothetical protein [Flavobacteriales bacterium]